MNSKSSYLNAVVDSADTAPTAAEQSVFAELGRQLEVQLATWREVVAKHIPALNEAMQRNNVPLVGLAVSAR